MAAFKYKGKGTLIVILLPYLTSPTHVKCIAYNFRAWQVGTDGVKLQIFASDLERHVSEFLEASPGRTRVLLDRVCC